MVSAVCYTLGIYLLNQFLAFLQPKFDPSLTQDEGLEDGEALPTKADEEFRPFIRRLPEFKFWHSSTRAIGIAFFCTWWQLFNVPVFWPVLVVYFFVLFGLTSEFPLPLRHGWRVVDCWKRGRGGLEFWSGEWCANEMYSAETDPAYDQISLRSVHVWEGKV